MNKCTEVMEHIADYNADVAFISETWMPNNENDSNATIKSYGYKFLHDRRRNREKSIGGGTGIILKDTLVSKHIKMKQFSSFEHTIVKVKINNNTYLTLISIYRVLFVQVNLFLEEFTALLEYLNGNSDPFIIAGDINIHLDNKDNTYTKQFNELLEMFNLIQHIDFPTHSCGHMIDVIISRKELPKIRNIKENNIMLSDHLMVLFEAEGVNLAMNEFKHIKYRNLKSVDNEEFCTAIRNCYENTCSRDFGLKVSTFNSQALDIVNSFAPIKSKLLKVVENAPWFDLEYKMLRQRRRKAEKNFKRTGNLEHKLEFVNLRKQTTNLALIKKKSYYATKLDECKGNTKSLFALLNKLVGKKHEAVLPSHESTIQLAERFKFYFKDKITKIRKCFSKTNYHHQNSCFPIGHTPLTTFEHATEEEITKIIKSHGINCSPGDPVPLLLLKNNLNLFIPIWTDLVNLSLDQGSIECLKSAILIPLIKELDELVDTEVLKNYRPVSNLLFLSKLIERVVAIRLESHMNTNNLHSDKQYGYKKGHSTEMLLIKVVNDLFIACDKNTNSVLMLLDLSAAFDTVDQRKLLGILYHEIGIQEVAYKWFESFLIQRTQKVKIKESYSSEDTLDYGVPQGSVLGPILFNIYIRSFYHEAKSAGFDVEGYADDHQLKRSFSPLFQVTSLGDNIRRCFDIIDKWMNAFFLRLNADKTKIMIISPPSLKEKIIVNGTFIKGKCIRFVTSAKNLGIILDNELSFETHIQKLAESCLSTIYKISRIKHFLSKEHLKTLVTSLVLSKLDYCNALYLGLSSNLIMKLQSVQNSAARLICKINRFDPCSISKIIKDLHWLRVKERITFKVLLIIHKSLLGVAPVDLQGIFTRSNSERSVKLETRRCYGKYGDKSIYVKGPKLWNSLPASIRMEKETEIFKKHLKTFLFSSSDSFYIHANMI